MTAAAPSPNPAVQAFLERTTMQSILEIDQAALDHVMATAYLLYQAGRYREVDVLCRGLIAVDHSYWWSYSLHAAALRRMGRLAEALEQVDNGLRFEPAETKLLLMRGEILAALGGWKERTPSSNDPTPTPAVVVPTGSPATVAVDAPAAGV
jgi:tetratricopeptide (TPR) repeat protein